MPELPISQKSAYSEPLYHLLDGHQYGFILHVIYQLGSTYVYVAIASVPFLCLSIISSGKLCAFNFTCYLSAARINKMLWCSISALFSDSNFCYSVGLSIFTLFNMLLPPFLDVPTLSPSCSHTFLYVINWSWYSCKDSYLSYWIW